MARMESSCKMIPCNNQLNDCGNLTSLMHHTSFDATMLNKVCSDFGTMRKCVAGADKCPPKIIRLLETQYDMYEKQCDCIDQLNKCNANVTGILMKRTFDLATLHKVCNELGEIETCVLRANKCSPEYIRLIQTSLTVYKTECTRFARCSQSVQNCAGQSAKTFSSLISNFTFDDTSVKKLCHEEGKLSSCLNKSVDCPPEYVRKYESVMTKVRTHCSKTACAMKALQCGVDVFDGVDIMKLNDAALLGLCNNLVGVEKCLSTLDQSCRVLTQPITFWTDRCDVFVRKSLCATHICLNGGTCEVRTNTANCACVTAFTGGHCETPLTTTPTTTTAKTSGQRGSGYITFVIVSSLTASLLMLAGHV
ncbi:hypothetical protein NP493_292g01005 [Ridgeia piscesae]|uniref:EGF-like domain-containing protein n=1 Tax=Ridgeia piscesae TaxID=27915 RepID=A0AAD9NWT2_RIDPI|nr:hypothetical protein NP493_292g01005 [Ridgeia piscesae]